MGEYIPCSEAYAYCSGTVQALDKDETVTFSNCPAYQVQSGDTWEGLTLRWYNSDSSTAQNSFIYANGWGGLGTELEAGWWLWLPTWIEGNSGHHDLDCGGVLPACNSISADQLSGGVFVQQSGPPANGYCGY